MSFIKNIIRSKYLELENAINFSPIFWFLGIKTRISENFHSINISVPLRWHTKSNNGVLFGGCMLLASDPFPSLLFERLIPNIEAWNTSHSIQYLRPAMSSVVAQIDIDPAVLDDLKKQIEISGVAKKRFTYPFVDQSGNTVAMVKTSTYLRPKSASRTNPVF